MPSIADPLQLAVMIRSARGLHAGTPGLQQGPQPNYHPNTPNHWVTKIAERFAAAPGEPHEKEILLMGQD